MIECYEGSSLIKPLGRSHRRNGLTKKGFFDGF